MLLQELKKSMQLRKNVEALSTVWIAELRGNIIVKTNILTILTPMFTYGFVTFLRSLEMEHWCEMS